MRTHIVKDEVGQVVFVYDCGWRIAGSHPYRLCVDGEEIVWQPIGLLAFFKETGVLPQR